MGMIMQINDDLQISTKTEICPSMASDVWVRKLDGIKSSITKSVILIIHVRSGIGSINQRCVSQKKKHDDIQTPKSVGLTEWLKRGSPRRS